MISQCVPGVFSSVTGSGYMNDFPVCTWSVLLCDWFWFGAAGWTGFLFF